MLIEIDELIFAYINADKLYFVLRNAKIIQFIDANAINNLELYSIIKIGKFDMFGRTYHAWTEDGNLIVKMQRSDDWLLVREDGLNNIFLEKAKVKGTSYLINDTTTNKWYLSKPGAKELTALRISNAEDLISDLKHLSYKDAMSALDELGLISTGFRSVRWNFNLMKIKNELSLIDPVRYQEMTGEPLKAISFGQEVGDYTKNPLQNSCNA